jgi:hypothetical protein
MKRWLGSVIFSVMLVVGCAAAPGNYQTHPTPQPPETAKVEKHPTVPAGAVDPRVALRENWRPVGVRVSHDGSLANLFLVNTDQTAPVTHFLVVITAAEYPIAYVYLTSAGIFKALELSSDETRYEWTELSEQNYNKLKRMFEDVFTENPPKIKTYRRPC